MGKGEGGWGGSAGREEREVGFARDFTRQPRPTRHTTHRCGSLYLDKDGSDYGQETWFLYDETGALLGEGEAPGRVFVCGGEISNANKVCRALTTCPPQPHLDTHHTSFSNALETCWTRSRIRIAT